MKAFNKILMLAAFSGFASSMMSCTENDDGSMSLAVFNKKTAAVNASQGINIDSLKNAVASDINIFEADTKSALLREQFIVKNGIEDYQCDSAILATDLVFLANKKTFSEKHKSIRIEGDPKNGFNFTIENNGQSLSLYTIK